MLDGHYEKQPSEQESVKVQFANRINSFVVAGYAITAIEVKIYDDAATDKSSTMLDSSSYSGTDVYLTPKGGTDGKDYWARMKLTCTKAGSPTQTIEEDLQIKVRQKGKA